MKLYFDWSDLNLFHRVLKSEQGLEVPEDFSDTINKIFAKHEIVLSFNHLSDIGRGSDEVLLRERANWLDSLPTVVWVLPAWRFESIEYENLASAELSINKTFKAPFCKFEDVFSFLGHDLTRRIVVNPTIARFVDEVALTDEGKDQLSRIADGSMDVVKTLFDDIKMFKARGAPAVGLLAREHKSLNYHAKMLFNAIARINPRIYRDIATFFANELAKTCPSRWDFLPYNLLMQMYLREFQIELSVKPALTQTFLKKQKSNLDDAAHMLGAGYCDLFTCDKRTYARIENVKTNLKAKVISRGANSTEYFAVLESLK